MGKIKLPGKITLVEQKETSHKDGNIKDENFNDGVIFVDILNDLFLKMLLKPLHPRI